MIKVFKWAAIILGALIGLIVLAAVALNVSTGLRLSRTYAVQPAAVVIPTDAAAVERGRHLVEAFVDCGGCHGENLGGTAFFDDPAIGRVYAPNLTSGEGGMGAATDADWVRALRHGLNEDGRALIIMPAEVFRNLSSEDLGAVIAYVKSQPPVDNETPEPAFTFMARVLIAAGAFGKPFPAEYIDHASPPPPAPAQGATDEYGQYLVSISGCVSCHGADLAGGQPPEPGAPPGPNLTPGGELVGWSEANFIAAMRAGVTLSGDQLSESMPWKAYGKATDDELKGIWLYLQSLPAKETAAQ